MLPRHCCRQAQDKEGHAIEEAVGHVMDKLLRKMEAWGAAEEAREAKRAEKAAAKAAAREAREAARAAAKAEVSMCVYVGGGGESDGGG
jgi:hypothetical protein